MAVCCGNAGKRTIGAFSRKMLHKILDTFAVTVRKKPVTNRMGSNRIWCLMRKRRRAMLHTTNEIRRNVMPAHDLSITIPEVTSLYVDADMKVKSRPLKKDTASCVGYTRNE